MTRDLSALLETPRIRLEPTTVDHAYGLAEALEDPAMYEHIGGTPKSAQEWTALLGAWSTRQSPDGSQRWLNWAAARKTDRRIIGWLQATVTGDRATIAYMIGTPWQGVGYATEAVGALIDHLRAAGIGTVDAFIGPANRRSQAVVRRLGFTTDDSPPAGDDEEHYVLRTVR